MDIKSHRHPNGIGRKILLTNLTTLSITLIVVFLAFYLLIPVYFRQNTQSELKKSGIEIVKALDTMQTLEGGTASDRQKRLQLLRTLQEIRVAGKVINARMALVDADGNIRLTNINDFQPDKLTYVLKRLDSSPSDYVHVKIPFKSVEGNRTGVLYLFAKTEDISGVNQGVFLVLMGSLFLGGFISFLFSWRQQRRIEQPLNTLVTAVESFSPRSFTPVSLESYDELQTLAEAFNRMADTLRLTDEAQTQLLQDISHELKTPLMSVQGYAEAIKDGILEGDDADRSLDVIIHESQRLKRLVEGLLLLSKLENQDSSYHFSMGAASEILSLSVNAVGGYARENGIALRLLQEEDFTAWMDQDRMIQCLVNILGNGIRYADTEILISLSMDSRDGIIRILDDGKGFEPDEAERIFQRFYKGSQGGAGIGLTIAHAIAVKHGGSLSARNGETGGAEFTVRIPLCREQTDL